MSRRTTKQWAGFVSYFICPLCGAKTFSARERLLHMKGHQG